MEVCVKGIPKIEGTKEGPNGIKLQYCVYPEESRLTENVCDPFFDQVQEEFGMRALRGTAIAFHNPDSNLLYSTERLFRSYLDGKKIKHAVEIGTWRGVSTALLAHYADKVTTHDLVYYPEPMTVWMYFGVNSKIKYLIVENNEAKKQALERIDFDFAFIDGDHTKEGVAYDFELVKRCGRVLFHDYGIKHCHGVTDFIETLPQEELKLKRPFAYWEKK